MAYKGSGSLFFVNMQNGPGRGQSEPRCSTFGTYPDRLCKFSLHREVRGFSDTDGKTGHALHVFEFELSGWMPSQSNPCL